MVTGPGGPTVSWSDAGEKLYFASKHVQRLLKSGGECDVSDVLATHFDVTLSDGRVLRRCGIHGVNGTLRGNPERALARARLILFGESRRAQQPMDMKIYLVLRWFGESAVMIPRTEIVSIDLPKKDE